MNGKKFDGGLLTEAEQSLRDFYKRLLNITIHSPALMGHYRDIHYYNREHTHNYTHKVLSFVRWCNEERLVVVSNFDDVQGQKFDLKIPPDLLGTLDIANGKYPLEDLLNGTEGMQLEVTGGTGHINVEIPPLGSLILKLD